MAVITIEQALNCPNLPSLPTVALDVIALTNRRNVNVEEIAKVVQNDQALAAKILRTVNSSYYGLTKPCPTITRALTYLGLSTVKSLVLGFSLVDTTRDQAGFRLEPYWRAVYGAAASRRIAMLAAVGDPEEVFVAALMQDIGMPALNAACGAAYAALIEQAGEAHDNLAAIEMKTLGFNHAQAGGRLAEKWRLSDEMVTAIKFHHAPDAAPAHVPLVRCVALGVQVAAALTVPDAGPVLQRVRELAGRWFDLTEGQIDGMLEQISEDARDIARLFRVNTGETPDVNQILEQAEEAAARVQFDVQRETETLRQTNSDLARMALTDGLTGAGNRNFFDTELHRLYAQSRATGQALAVIMVDADRFKSLNDTYGHQVGDSALIEIAWRMKSAAINEGALVCRYGGEEFAVLLPQTDRRSAAQLAEAIRVSIGGAPVVVRAPGPVPSVPVTVSLGVAVFDPNIAGSRMTTPQLVVQAADKALYAAKNGGRNCVRVFSEKPVTASPSASNNSTAAAA